MSFDNLKNCERQLKCSNSLTNIIVGNLNEISIQSNKIECKVEEYLSCNPKLLEYLNITENYLIEKSIKYNHTHFNHQHHHHHYYNLNSKQVKSNDEKNLHNQIDFIWYDTDGIRLSNDLKTTLVNQIEIINKLISYKPKKYGNLTCMASIKSDSNNTNNQTNNYVKSLNKEKDLILRLLIENLNYIKFNKLEQTYSQSYVTCTIQLIEEKNNFISNYYFYIIIIFLFILMIFLYFFKKFKLNSTDTKCNITSNGLKEVKITSKSLFDSETINSIDMDLNSNIVYLNNQIINRISNINSNLTVNNNISLNS